MVTTWILEPSNTLSISLPARITFERVENGRAVLSVEPLAAAGPDYKAMLEEIRSGFLRATGSFTPSGIVDILDSVERKHLG